MKGGHSYRKSVPLSIPQDREGAQSLNPAIAGLTTDHLHTPCKEMRAILMAAFDLIFSLRPLPLCHEVPEQFTYGFVLPQRRYVKLLAVCTRYTAAERKEKQAKSFRRKTLTYGRAKVNDPQQSRGSRKAP